MREHKRTFVVEIARDVQCAHDGETIGEKALHQFSDEDTRLNSLLTPSEPRSAAELELVHGRLHSSGTKAFSSTQSKRTSREFSSCRPRDH